MIKSPCLDCPKRCNGCHSVCTLYAAFRYKKAFEAKAKNADSDYNNYISSKGKKQKSKF